MIPMQNVDNLMLKDEVISAVKDGLFHIYAIKSIDEGIEVLTGRSSGRNTDKGFVEGSVFDLAYKKLRRFSEAIHAMKR
jgi:predicted ATP-dependent protease